MRGNQQAGISQRMIAYDEGPEAHRPAHLLADMARVLGLAPMRRAKKAEKQAP